MHVLVRFEDVGSAVEQVVEELGHQQGRSLVLLTRQAHLVLQLEVVRLEQLVLLLRLAQLLLDFFQLMLEEVDQVVVVLG